MQATANTTMPSQTAARPPADRCVGAPASPARSSSTARLRRMADYVELTKPRVLSLVLVSTAVGFCIAANGSIDIVALVQTVAATALVAGGANALNQLLERDTDARMQRTAGRPLPTRRLRPDEVLRFGVLSGSGGVLYLALLIDLTAAMLAAVTLAGYVFVYTPLKRRTALATLVGAVPGALPPLIGWAAAGGALGREAAAVFAILFLWQLPHFLAIAWLYRDDYARAGLPLLTNADPSGALAGRQIVVYSAALLPVSLMPTALGVAGGAYFAAALVLSLLFLGFAVWMALTRSTAAARGLFRFSIVHLPLLFAAMLIDKVSH